MSSKYPFPAPLIFNRAVYIPVQLVREADQYSEPLLRGAFAQYVSTVACSFPAGLPTTTLRQLSVTQDARTLRRNINWLYNWSLVFAAADALPLATAIAEVLDGSPLLQRDLNFRGDTYFEIGVFQRAAELVRRLHSTDPQRTELDWTQDQIWKIKRQLHKINRLRYKAAECYQETATAV